jgi:hypothetical protein
MGRAVVRNKLGRLGHGDRAAFDLVVDVNVVHTGRGGRDLLGHLHQSKKEVSA